MMTSRVSVSEPRLHEFCRSWNIRRLAIFGSAIRRDFRPDSDLDVLVEFDPGRAPGLSFFRLQDEFSEMMGRRVDLNTPACLSPHFRDNVLRIAEDLYVAP